MKCYACGRDNHVPGSSIMANGTDTADGRYEPPTHAQQLNAARHRAKAAEGASVQRLAAADLDDETLGRVRARAGEGRAGRRRGGSGAR